MAHSSFVPSRRVVLMIMAAPLVLMASQLGDVGSRVYTAEDARVRVINSLEGHFVNSDFGMEGLKQISVSVKICSAVASDFSAMGVDAKSLQNLVELELRTVGVDVLGADQRSSDTGTLVLDACGFVSRAGGHDVSYVYIVGLHLYQGMMLFRDPQTLVVADTWTAGETIRIVGAAHRASFESNFRDSVLKQLQNFMNEYLKANPVKAAQPDTEPRADESK